MSELDPFGAASGLPSLTRKGYEIRLSQRRVVLHRVLEFTRCSIHDVINDRAARQKVTFYFKLSRYIDRESDRIDAAKGRG